MTRTFTLEEANALLPRLSQALRSTLQILAAARATARRLKDAGLRPASPDDLLPAPADVADPELAQETLRAHWLLDAAREEARAIERLGVVVRDVERGKIDFRSVLDGQREVFLCWALGEPEIRYFHDLHAGFVGRQAIGEHRFFRSRQLVPPRSGG